MNSHGFEPSGVDGSFREPGDTAPPGPPTRPGAPNSGLFAWYEPGYSDGLGDRLRLFDNTDGPPLELLRLRPELADVPHFEFSLRERAFELARFEDRHHARVCRVDRLPEPGGGLAVVCERADGQRLADVLRAAENRSLTPGPDVTQALVADLLAALAAFHGRGRQINHGALSPDRIVVAPGGRFVVTEYVFGSALRRLPYDRERLWRDFGFAVPADQGGGARPFDQQTDVLQAGLVALALALGRRLGPQDYPAGIPNLLREARERSAATFFEWLERAVGVGRDTFRDGLEARKAFAALIGTSADRSLHPAFWPALLAAAEDSDWIPVIAEEKELPRASLPVLNRDGRLAALAPGPRLSQAGPLPPRAPGAGDPAPGEPHDSWAESLDELNRDGGEAAPPPFPRREVGASAVGHDDSGPASRAPQPAGALAPEAAATHPQKRRRWQVAALVALALVASAEALYIVSRGSPQARPAAQLGGRLTIASEPSGAEVTLDGEPVGRTPVALDVASGPHVVDLSAGTRRRSLNLTVEDGSSPSHFIELPPSVSEAGSLRVTTEPPGVEVRVDGERRGVTPLTVADLAPGPHEVAVHRGGRSIRQTVAIAGGVTAALFVPIPDASEVTAGWLTVKSAVELHVFERGELVGVSRSGRIMLQAGPHDVEVVNEAVGFRATREIDVPAGGTTVVEVEMPGTTIDINATPWAEVWIDGRRVGETPLGGVPVAIGPHEVTFSHPQLGERKVNCLVSLHRPTRLSVDLSK